LKLALLGFSTSKYKGKQRMYLFPNRFPAFMVFWAKAHSAPVITAQLAKKAILALMLLEALMLFFRNINFSL